MKSNSNQNISELLSVFSILALALGLSCRFFYWDFDDSYIVYRIVNNISNHGEWAYNIGEAHNASTSVLNTILVAIVGFVFEDVRTAAHLIGGVSLFGTGLLTYLLFKNRAGTIVALLGSGWAMYAIATSSTWGIESHLFASLFLLFVYCTSSELFSWGITALLILTRPDALILAALKFFKEMILDRKIYVKGIIFAAVLLAPWLIFSMTQFGQLFPDTLSAKVWQGQSGYWGNGPIYLKALVKHLLFENWVRTITLVVSLPGMLLWIRQRDRFLYFLIFVLIQQSAYCVLNVPGYHWYFFSLDLIIILASLTSISGGLKYFGASQVIPSMAYIKGLSVVLLFGFAAKFGIYADYARDVRNESYKKAIQFLDRVEPDHLALATLEVGTIGFYTNRKIIDLVGLASNNPQYINGENLDHFFASPAPLVLLHNPIWHFERALTDDLRFRIMYEFKNNIEDPYYGMQYYKFREGNLTISSQRVEEYVKAHYHPFKMVPQAMFPVLSPNENALCILDQINGQLATETIVPVPHHVLRLTGWAVEKDVPALGVPIVYLVSEDKRVAFSMEGARFDRPDVAKHLNNDYYVKSGFDAEGSILDIPPGTYDVGVLQAEDSRTIFCQFGKKIVINN